MTPLGTIVAAAIIACLLVALFVQGINVGRRRERDDMATPPNVQPPLPTPAPVAPPAPESRPRRQPLLAARNVRANHRPPRDRWLPS